MSLLDQFERGIGRQIEEAQQKGAFENLPGKGKPLNLNNNPNADPEKDLAFKLLNDNEFVLPWMDKGQQIDRELSEARKSLSMTWDLLQQTEANIAWAQSEWIRAREAFRVRIAAVNRIIRDYNLEIPSLRLERFVIDAEAEIIRISGSANSNQSDALSR